MTDNLKKLYPEIIRQHNDAPYHFEKRVSDEMVYANNPVCGDKFEFAIERNSQSKLQFHFHGFGCAISKASASILSKTLEGKSQDEALFICDHFLRFLQNTLKKDEAVLEPDFLAFSAIHAYPERYECAALAWVEMRDHLKD